MKYLQFLFLCFLIGSCQVSNRKEVSDQNTGVRPNILFIVIDDLRPELGCYGNKAMISPNIDRLASSGLLFEKAYCQYPVCGPSRASVLTGLYPSKTRFASNISKVDEETPEIVTLPEHFKQNGYYVVSNGKVFHDHGNVIDGLDSWSEIPWEPHPGFWVWQEEDNKQYTLKGYKKRREYHNNPGPAWDAAAVSDDGYPTGLVTDKTVADLKRLKKMDKPFFMAVGYRKPHLPLNAPKKYWDLYKRSQFELADNFNRENELPAEVFTNSAELRSYSNIPKEGEIDTATWRTLLHGYYACVSYTDAQIGRLLDGLKSEGLDQNTIVVLWGDHGYQLTEHGMWSKHNTLDVSMNAPLILSVPGKTKGNKTSKLVEFLDIYPALSELAGLEKPLHLQGNSFVPLIENPALNWKESVFIRCKDAETVVTEKYALTEWINEQGSVYQRMLFNHETDPKENINLADSQDYKKTVKRLDGLIRTHIDKR